ncbi:C-type mannose receptor 2-like [Amia ocellicauda]|uniref:C-type mannose receptor 2-like n=1 Tax=Amia ocellicauda TaxID=2972642 RepID=UPI0034647008
MAKIMAATILLAVLCAVASYPIYHLVRSPQSWHDAQRYCREMYTDLATVDKQETAEQILNLFSPSSDSNAWIGLSWKGQNWLWSNGEKVTYYNWRRKSFCTLVNNEGLWIDKPCFYQHYFMCYTVGSNGNKTYTLIKQAKSWAAAREYCRQNYNDLACIESQSENEEVMKNGQGTDFWIGLFNDPWKWSDGGVSAFRDWNNQEPNNWAAPENCVVLYSDGWADASCSRSNEVLCCEVGGYDNDSGSCQRTGQVKIMSEGQALCRDQYGTDLPTIYNYQQAVQMKAQYLSSRFLWIGLYRDRENWQWVNGETVLYSNWKTSHFCASADSEGYWQDRDCNDQLPFMCYKEYSNGTRTYTLLQTRKTWAAAQGHCRQLYTDLASIQDQSENEAVMESGLGRAFWIGLFNDPWKWSDGSKSLFRDWNVPQSVSNECAAVSSTSNGKWLYLPCLTTISFVCYEEVHNITLVKLNMTWEEARDYCRSHHTDLTSIVSKRDQFYAVSASADAQSSHVWLGLRLSLVTGSWFWVNREPLLFNNGTKGGYGQCPKSSYCGALSARDGGWAGRSCGERMNFICYTGQ